MSDIGAGIPIGLAIGIGVGISTGKKKGIEVASNAIRDYAMLQGVRIEGPQGVIPVEEFLAVALADVKQCSRKGRAEHRRTWMWIGVLAGLLALGTLAFFLFMNAGG